MKPRSPQRLWALRAIPAGVALLSASTLWAQTAPPEAATEVVLVTAQKRTERLQDVPIAISALSGSQLESRNISSVADLGSIAPNLSVSNTPGNATASQIAIRGGVTTNPALFWDTAVGVYVDGVYMGKTQGSIFSMVDLERVEVLRGPQGTLYGRNTMSGAINFITRQPSGEYGGEASLSLGSYSERVMKASLDLPKMGIASVSLGLRTEDRDGWVKTTPGSSVKDLYGSDQMQARLGVNLDFSPDVRVAYRYDLSDIDQTPSHSQLFRLDPSGPTATYPSAVNFVSKNRQKLASVDGPLEEKSEVQGHSVTLDWKLDENNSLKSITSYRTTDWRDALDLDGSPFPIAHTQRISDYSQKSQELQWVGNSGSMNYVVGGYVFHDDGFTNNPQQYYFGNSDSKYGFTTKSNAMFGQMDYRLTDRWTLTGGLRRTSETKTIERELAFAGFPLVPVGTVGKTKFSATTPLLVAAFKLNDSTNVYAKFAEGFKSGGFNGESANPVEVLNPFRAEQQKTYELGMKQSFAGGKGALNTALFRNSITDLQRSVFIPGPSAASEIRNVGEATTQGLEMEVSYAPTPGLRLQASYGYLDASYDEYIEGGVNVANNRAVVHAPKHSFSVALDWVLAQTTWGPLRLQTDYTYKSSFYLYPYQLRAVDANAAIAGDTRVPSMGILNGRLLLSNVKTGYGRMQLALWGRNLTDHDKPTNFIDFGPGAMFGSMTQAYYVMPRTVGVSASLKW